MLEFYKKLCYEIKISVTHISGNSLNHKEKIEEAIGLVMLSIIAVLPPIMIISGLAWFF